ncbi:CehA/McbA family metallohydrolase [Tautonia rosea]|uniref:CehA/McbA family metallohydrolase n=1 Tax=Tautonia rosea TaxID=2728037 RepID=UPI001474A1F2|nr:CehA/McbA family metallohydrolase [Tautonia rosea]
MIVPRHCDCKILRRGISWLILLASVAVASPAVAQELRPTAVEGQPLAANVGRVLQALELLGAPLPASTAEPLGLALETRDALSIQELLDAHVLAVVSINPEERVKVARGPAPALLQQGGFTPVLVKVLNESTASRRMTISSPQSGPVTAGAAMLSMTRQDQLHLKEGEVPGGAPGRFLQVELFDDPPMTPNLSGLGVEYAVALIYSAEAGVREATLGFAIGPGTQDLGFRGEVPILFQVRPAIPVTLRIRDVDGSPTTARLTFLDRSGQVYPPQAKRVAPDLFFQRQIYRKDGDVVLLPPGRLTMISTRGPEYRELSREVILPEQGDVTLEVPLERWIDPARFGFFSGDHHIHAAGCAHYTDPTQGIVPEDVFLQVQGEGLNVGCVLTWGPCYDYQRGFFEPTVHGLSEPFTLLKYDVEVSGFGSQALGHVCLLNLRDQTYPGSENTATTGWPSWTIPVLRWAKNQGAITGYAHSASGLQIDPERASGHLMETLDADADGVLSPAEARAGLLPEDFETVDADRDGVLIPAELRVSHDRVADTLPNLAVPEMDGVGAMEIVVAAPLELCDFISAMDTPRIAEWNMWYHLLNCGFPMKVSGETDFPCMSGMRVGQGRVYVQLGAVEAIDFDAWCEGLACGRSYVSDGYAHALEFTVGGASPGAQVERDGASTLAIHAKVAFAPELPRAVAYGSLVPAGGPRLVGDTVDLHGPRLDDQFTEPGEPRIVELVVNGQVVASREVPADGEIHALEFDVPIDRSSWVALRQFPQLHTNPVEVIVSGQPIRASRQSAQWCLEALEQLWRRRGQWIAPAERDEARAAYDRARQTYQQMLQE